MKVVHKGFVLIAIPLLFMGGVLASMLWLAGTEEALLIGEARSKKITAISVDVAARLLNYRAAVALFTLTGDPSYSRPLQTAPGELQLAIHQLDQVTRDDAIEAQYVTQLRPQARDFVEMCNKLVMSAKHGDKQTVVETLQRHDLSAKLQEVNSIIDHIRTREADLTGYQPSELVLFRQKFQSFLVVLAILGALLACGLAYFFASQISSRLLRLSQNAERLSGDRPLAPPLGGSDELAFLDSAFHDAAASLKAVEALRRQFLEMVTHDLRSPLTSISLILQSLVCGCYGEFSPEARKSLDDAQESTRRLLRLVESLLTADKIAAGALEINATACDTKEILQLSVNEVKALADEKHIDLVVDNAEDAELSADKDRLTQVLVNLLSNAIKFSSDGAQVKLKCAKSGAQQIRFEVIDNGRGIPPSHLESIFDRYSQVDANDALRGSGLGLPICKAIVEAHAGQIGVESEPGKGSTFFFLLPAGVNMTVPTESSPVIPQ